MLEAVVDNDSKDVWGKGGIITLLLNLCIIRKSMIRLTLCPFYSRWKNPVTYCIGKQMGSRVGLDSLGKLEIICPSLKFNPDFPLSSP